MNITEKQSTARRPIGRMLLRICNRYAPVVSIVAWMAAPIYQAIAGAEGEWNGRAFVSTLGEPISFIPGFLALLLTIMLHTMELHAELRSTVEAAAEHLGNQINGLSRDSRELQQAIGDSSRLRRVYSRLRVREGSTAPIAGFAQDIYDGAFKQLLRLDRQATYTLDCREKTHRYADAWIQAFEMIMKSGETGRFRTVSNMVIWSSELGLTENGFSEYHTRQVTYSAHGRLEMQRVFVMPPQFVLEAAPTQAARYLAILEAYRDKTDEIWDKIRGELEHEKSGRAKEGRPINRRDAYQDRVYATTDDQQYRRHFETRGKTKFGSENFALWSVGEGDPIVANTVRYIHHSGKVNEASPYAPPLESFSFTWDPEVIARKLDEFKSKWETSIPLDEYFNDLRQIVAKHRSAAMSPPSLDDNGSEAVARPMESMKEAMRQQSTGAGDVLMPLPPGVARDHLNRD